MRIISGGQTGVDRAALDAARAVGVATGGWIPRGRWAEDGPIPERYGELSECESPDPAERTRLNVESSDATLILSHGPLAGGSALTRAIAERLGKPWLWLDLDRIAPEDAAGAARAWLTPQRVELLNVAGPRASEDSRAYADAVRVIGALLRAERRALT